MQLKTLLLAATLTAVGVLGLGACAELGYDAADTSAASTASVEVSGPTLVSAQFSGRSDHITTGTASIVGTPGNYTLVFAGDFSLDGAPDPVVGFGQNGTYNAATKLGALTQKTGTQSYSLPADFDPATAGEVYVWCEQFDVPLGVANFAAPAVANGSFEGRSDHITTGSVSIVGEAGQYQLVFAGDFSLDGAPDPVVGFGNNGAYDGATKLGALTKITGAQSYSLPADFNPASVSEVYVWCEKFSVPLGVATLSGAS